MAKQIELLLEVEFLVNTRLQSVHGEGKGKRGKNLARCKAQEHCSKSTRPSTNYFDLLLLQQKPISISKIPKATTSAAKRNKATTNYSAAYRYVQRRLPESFQCTAEVPHQHNQCSAIDPSLPPTYNKNINNHLIRI